MKTTILEIYAMAVCLLTLICFAIALGVGLYDVVQISFPGFTAGVSSVEGERARAMQSIVMVAVVLFVDSIIFIPHWMIGKKARGLKTT